MIERGSQRGAKEVSTVEVKGGGAAREGRRCSEEAGVAARGLERSAGAEVGDGEGEAVGDLKGVAGGGGRRSAGSREGLRL